jgi:hypothetical protein
VILGALSPMQILNFYKEGRKIPENAVYIGREMPKMGLSASLFANPFTLQNTKDDLERTDVIRRYRAHLWVQIRQGEIKEVDLLALQGKDLVCFCAPRACHGEIVRQAVEWARGRETERNVSQVRRETIAANSAFRKERL